MSPAEKQRQDREEVDAVVTTVARTTANDIADWLEELGVGNYAIRLQLRNGTWRDK